MNARALAALALLAIGCGAAALGPRRRVDIIGGPPFAACDSARPVSTDPISIVGTPAARAIEAATRAGLAVVHVADSVDGGRVEVLRCTRKETYASDLASGSADDIANAWDLKQHICDDERDAMFALADRRIPDGDVSFLWFRSKTTREITGAWRTDPARSLEDVHLGQMPLAPFDQSELTGPDCARATHFVERVTLGTYRLDLVGKARRDDPAPIKIAACEAPGCTSPLEIELVPLRLVGCPRSMVPGKNGCERPRTLGPYMVSSCDAVPGQTTEEAQQARRLFAAGKWHEAALAFHRVLDGETGDDLGNREIAVFAWGLATYFEAEQRSPRELLGSANYVIDAVANDDCNPAQRAAHAWLARLK